MIAVIDYDAGNVRSVMNALERLNVTSVLTSDHELLSKADKIIFPGVGHAEAAMNALKRKGLVELIQRAKQPVLGICVGMQLMCERSEEGDTNALGIVPGIASRIPNIDGQRVPHMGWNRLNLQVPGHALFRGVAPEDFVYFVHSYAMELNPFTIATCDYGVAFSAVIHRDNFYGVQFHVEKSGKVGEKILSNFLAI